MSEQAINNGIAENPDANRYERIKKAQEYHSPVEQKIRSYDEKVQSLEAAPVSEPKAEDFEQFINAEGVLKLPEPSADPVKPDLSQDPKAPAAAAQDGTGEPKAPAGDNPAQNDQNASEAPQIKNMKPKRRSIERDGSTYIIEDREDGPYVIGRQPGANSPLRMYQKGIQVDEAMLLPENERTFLQNTVDFAKDAAVTLGDTTTGALRGIGIGEAKLVTNAARFLVDNPVGDAVLGKERVDKFADFTNRFLDNLDKAAAKAVKTKAGAVAQTGGEITGQFIMPTLGAYNKLRALGANPITASLIAEGGVAIAGINPDNENLADLIDKDSRFAPVRELLGTDPDDPDWKNRARNATETFALLGIGEGVGRGIVKGIEEAQRFGKEIPEQTARLLDEAVKKGSEVAQSENTKKAVAGTAVAGAAGAAALTPEEAQANARKDLLQKAISLLNDVDRPAGKAVIEKETVDRMLEAVKAGENPAKGLDFNLMRIENGEELGQVIDEISNVYEKKIYKAKRGVQTFDVTQEKADLSRQMGFDVEAALSRQPGELWPAHKIKAARDLFTAEVEKTREMALAIKQPGGNSEDAMIAFRKQMAVTAALQMQLKGAQTEVARALSQFRMTAKSPLESRVQIREMIEQAGGPENQELMVDAFINAVENGGPDAAAIFSRQAHNASSTEMLFEAWINSLLGSPQTHIVNISGNGLAAAQGVMERYAAAGYGAAERGVQRALGREISPGGITFDEANAYASGLAGSTIDALRSFGRALKSGEQSDLYGKLDYHSDAITAQNINELPISKSIAGRLGKDELLDANSTLALMVDNIGEYYYRLPGRFLMAEDDFFKTLNYRAELHARATREGTELRRAGMTPEEIEARKLEVLRDPQVAAPEIHLGAVDQMREQTFTAAPPQGGPAEAINRARMTMNIGDFPAGRIVVPFFNVINNITKYAASRTPGLALINPKSKTFQDLFSGDAARRQLVMGKWATGGSIMGTFAWLNLNGVCTGRLTDNPKLRAQMETQGKQAYSCMIPMPDGSHRVASYSRLEPAGMLAGIATTTAEAMHYVDSEEEREMLGIAAVAAIMPYMEDKAFFKGPADFLNAIMPQFGDDDARVDAMSRYFQGVLSSAPGAIAGPLAPGTPLSGFATREIAGDNTRRTYNPDKFRIEKDAWGDDVLVPNGTVYRTWEGTIKRIMSRTPGLSDKLPARKNIWGEDQIMQNGVMSDGVLSPIYSNDVKYDVTALRNANLPDKVKNGYFYGAKVGQDMTVDQFADFVKIVGINGELERLGAPISMPRKQISARNGNKVLGLPVDMNDQQYADFLEIMNGIKVTNDADPQRRRMNMKEALDWFVKQPEYAKLPDDGDATGSKGDMLRSLSNKYRDAAVNLFFSEHKDGAALMRRSIELKLKAQNTGAQ